MPNNSSKQGPDDLNELAFRLVSQLTEETSATETSATETTPSEPIKNAAAVASGRLGGKKGGKARAAKLTLEQRREIAQIAANARWKKGD